MGAALRCYADVSLVGGGEERGKSRADGRKRLTLPPFLHCLFFLLLFPHRGASFYAVFFGYGLGVLLAFAGCKYGRELQQHSYITGIYRDDLERAAYSTAPCRCWGGTEGGREEGRGGRDGGRERRETSFEGCLAPLATHAHDSADRPQHDTGVASLFPVAVSE